MSAQHVASPSSVSLEKELLSGTIAIAILAQFEMAACCQRFVAIRDAAIIGYDIAQSQASN